MHNDWNDSGSNTGNRNESLGQVTEPMDRDTATTLSINSKSSLIHIGSLDSFDITEGGKEAARKILDYFENGDPNSLKESIEIYDRIIPDENFGGEYTAIRWICKLLLSPDPEQNRLLSEPMVAGWYNLLSKDNFCKLKDYIRMKYHFVEISKDDPTARVNLRFLEDFILFNNPDRERWDKTSENLWTLKVEPGQRIIDFGSGPGYFTFKFADMVGEKGHVYAIETNECHIEYLHDYIRSYKVDNVDVIQFTGSGIDLKNSDKVDLVFMCSLYHVIYAASTDGERDILIESIRDCLKDDGRFVIIDNDLVENEELPYHGPYITRDLIISQLRHYGFALIKQYQFSVQRYVLEFRKTEIPGEDLLVQTPAFIPDPKNPVTIRVTSRSSLVRYRMLGISSQGYTISGKKAARLFYDALETKDETTIHQALKVYDDLIPRERIGDEYSAFQWFCQYLLSTPDQQERLLSDQCTAEFFSYMAAEDYSFLKRYIWIKYDLEKPDPKEPDTNDPLAQKRLHDVVYEYSGKEVSFEQLNDWSEFITFNNPNRESWEKTSEMLKFLNIREGETIADVGCGTGFFSFKFADMVGKSGKVYATEINTEPLSYVDTFSGKHGLNITTIKAELNDAKLPENFFDTIYMCSMYHAVYIASIEFVKDEFITSLKRALKSGGRLIVVDNSIAPPGAIPYFGSGIAKELVIAQLHYYGFQLIESQSFVPQRYVLIFKKD